MSDLKKKCVYTCLIGSYEDLNEQEVAQTSSVDFICFTDDPSLTSKTWKIRQVVPTFEADPIRSQRVIKLLADEYVGEYQESLYIDNSIILKETPEFIFDKYLPNPIDYALPVHSYRDTVIDEFLEVARLGFDDQNRIMEQLNHYALYAGEVLAETPYWTAIMLRRHHQPWIKSLGREWLAHILRYSRRDQLSVNYAFTKVRHSPSQILIDNFSSEFHQWPVTKNRERTKGYRDIATSLMNSVAHTKQLEVKNQELGVRLENLKAFEAKNQELRENLTQSETQHQELRAQIEHLTQANNDLQIRLNEESTGLRHLNYAVEQRLATLKFRLFERSLSQTEMRQSLSWRITKPLREITRFLSNFKTQTNKKSSFTSKPPAIVIQCRNGKTIYANPRDERALVLEKHSGDFNPTSLAMWQKILTTQAWTDVVDVGANYGEMLLNIEPPPSAAFIAVEPNPNVFPFLKKSLNEAGLKVTLIKEALSSKQGHADLFLNHSWSGMSGIIQAQAGLPHHSTSTYKVKLTTLDLLLDDKKRPLSKRKILIKIDVEGHELEVLAGATKILKNCADFAIQVEVLHLEESQLNHLLQEFKILIYHKSKNSFTEIDSTNLSDVYQYLKDGDHYNQDVILTKRNKR